MIKKIANKLGDSAWFAPLIAYLGWGVYFIQAWTYAHIQTSFLDEGGYLYVGDLFARGVLRPFQDYGTIRQYAPLVYLIPGQIEAWFGASLKTGRFFSVFCGLMLVIAVWICANRLGGKWLGAAVVWGMALTPISIQIYSLAISEALVGCLLAWSLMLVLGKGRRLWQIVTGAFLAGIMVMTRQNLVTIIPLMAAYIFWQHGKKAGLWALTGFFLPILVIHIIYWPNILQIWATWLPTSLTPFLNAFRPPTIGLGTVVSVPFSDRLSAFLQGIRFHYFSCVGFLVCLFLWPRRDEWKSQSNRRAGIFLAILFISTALIHAWASFVAPDPYCTFCFTPYLAFFDFSVFLLIAALYSGWKKKVSKIAEAAIIVFILILSTGLGYSSIETFGTWLLNYKFPAFTRGLNPLLWTPFISLWDILANKFNADYWTSRLILPIAAGLLLGVIFILAGILIYKKTSQKMERVRSLSTGSFLLSSILGIGIVLSPILGGTYRANGICQADILQSYENIGSTLNRIIPPSSQVFWDVSSAGPLLYTPGINIYVPQIYANSFYIDGGNAKQLQKFGYWNDSLAAQWWDEANYIVIENDYEGAYLPANFSISQFTITQTEPLDPCIPQSYLLVYQRKP